MAHASDSLLDFAAAVHEALPWVGAAPTERFGRRKVFVSALYAEMAKQAPYVPYSVGSLDAFKARLVDANREGLLSLARADLVAAMDPDAVAASEIRSLGSEFHFVIDPTAREPWEAASPAAYSAPPPSGRGASSSARPCASSSRSTYARSPAATTPRSAASAWARASAAAPPSAAAARRAAEAAEQPPVSPTWGVGGSGARSCGQPTTTDRGETAMGDNDRIERGLGELGKEHTPDPNWQSEVHRINAICDVLEGAGAHVHVDLRRHDDRQLLAAAVLAALAEVPPAIPSLFRCRYCWDAAGATEAAWHLLASFDDKTMLAHARTCEHNPLVKTIREYLAAWGADDAATDEWDDRHDAALRALQAAVSP